MENEEGVKTGRGRGGGRGGRGRGGGRGGARGRGGGRGRGGRGKKNQAKQVESDGGGGEEEVAMQEGGREGEGVPVVSQEEGGGEEMTTASKIDLEADILQLEAPTFSTINRGPPEPMLRLRWDHRVNLVAEKVLNPMIHCCDKCLKPILIYGRMIPCKHVFCLACAKREADNAVCPRCMQKVARVEHTGLGSVFMCTHGGTRYGNAGCRRTYLSQRDLQAHFNHRHVSNSAAALGGVTGDSSQDQASPVLILNTGSTPRGEQTTRLKPPQPSPQHLVSANDPRIPQPMDHSSHHPPRRTSPPPQFLAHRPPGIPTPGMYQPRTMSTNLITVQIQDTSTTCETTNVINPAYYSQPPPVTPYGPPYGVPPPVPPPQFYPGPPQTGPPPQFGAPPPMAPRAPVPVPYPEQSPYNPPPPLPPPAQWQHPPPTSNQPFYH
ncbi:hypothetical protein LSTR_LSTR007098 [Laodelphax striatellus]|uniref:E3 ubiquitin-protein ligase Hakai n=1 Tax=Laodelphax striatellus TaxID=195883 RepID=A0A482WF99_LAOST|nr:hypothetical protein LSTR_LSTR007098 [Laodelphax striatellus]